MAINNSNLLFLNNDGNCFLLSLNKFYNNKTIPQLLNNDLNLKYTQIVCGVSHLVVLSKCGKIFVLGENTRGQLGIGMNIKNTNILMFVETLGWTKIIKVVCGSWHVMVLNECGDVYSWGWNKYGQLGLGLDLQNISIIEYPTLIEFNENLSKNIIDISAGSKHSAVLYNDGTIYIWGSNEFYQITSINCKIYKTPISISIKKYNNKLDLNNIYIECGYNSTIIKQII